MRAGLPIVLLLALVALTVIVAFAPRAPAMVPLTGVTGDEKAAATTPCSNQGKLNFSNNCATVLFVGASNP